jgi:hypothetical protein
VPLKHFPFSQTQDFTLWLAAGEHPHEPMVHVLGKLTMLLQHASVEIVPPELMQAFSSGEIKILSLKMKKTAAAAAITMNTSRKYTPFFIKIILLFC